MLIHLASDIPILVQNILWKEIRYMFKPFWVDENALEYAL